MSGLVAASDSSPVDHRVFNKAIHSRDGLPTCAACGEHFSRWSGLRKHVVKGYCAVLHSVVPIEPPTVVHNFVPIALRPSVQEAVSRWGISGMLGFPDVMKEMLQRCVLCHQWVASSWQMKNHFRNSHPDFWKTHHASCDAYCKQQGECALVCKYCRKISDVRGGALAHMKRCTVLWQIAAVHHYLKRVEEPMDAQAQLDEFFGKVVTESAAKRPRTTEDEAQPRRSKGGGYGKGQKGHRRGTTEGLTGASPELLQCICRALVQHEDSVQVLRQDTAWVWFLRTDKPTIVPQLFQAAAAWKQEANQPTPGLVGRKPLREILFLTILRNLTDASYDSSSCTWPCGVGGLILNSSGSLVAAFSALLPKGLREVLGETVKETIIFEAEVVALICAMRRWRGLLSGKPVLAPWVPQWVCLKDWLGGWVGPL